MGWRLRQFEPCKTRFLLTLRGRKKGRKGTSRDGVVVIIDTLTDTLTAPTTTMKKIQPRHFKDLTRTPTGRNFHSS